MIRSAAETIDSYLSGLDTDQRRLSASEWGITVEAGGWDLHVGLALRDGLLRIQAPLAKRGSLDPGLLLWWNRRLPLVRFATSQDGEPWLCCDLPTGSVTERELDRVLGLFVLTATQARYEAASGDAERA